MSNVRPTRLAKIVMQKQLAAFSVQRLIDGEVAQVEEWIAHPGIFPVDNPDGSAIINKIASEQVIMAWLRLLNRPQCLFDASHQRKHTRQRIRESNAVLQRQLMIAA